MTKLTILIVALLFIAHTCCASKWQQHESCHKQLQRVNLKPCEKHVMEKIQGIEDEDDDVLTTVRGRINYLKKHKQQDEDEEGQMEKCCIEMSQLNTPKCQCKALKKIMENQSEDLEDKEKQQLEKELMNLAMMCRLGPMIGCDLTPED